MNIYFGFFSLTTFFRPILPNFEMLPKKKKDITGTNPECLQLCFYDIEMNIYFVVVNSCIIKHQTYLCSTVSVNITNSYYL